MKEIVKYFPTLTEDQIKKFGELGPIYRKWNENINVISRKDIENIYLHHILHSLAIAKYISFKPTTQILDLGTGGGFPGIPLSILFPDCKFHLVDSINKKLKVVEAVVEKLDLQNVTFQHIRVEEIKKQKFDFIVTRAVASAKQLLQWGRKHISTTHINSIPNGIIALKGGNLNTELRELGKGEYYDAEKISKYFKEAFFFEKSIIYIQG